MYHLLTHGAFKALLFLGCGSVILALHHEQDMRHMGGLKDKLPIDLLDVRDRLIGAGRLPLTAGFFSKDDHPRVRLVVRGTWPGTDALGLLTALLTAFYSFRLVFVTFWGTSTCDPHHAQHLHEPSRRRSPHRSSFWHASVF